VSLFVAETGVWLRVSQAPQSTVEEVHVEGLHVELQSHTNWCWAAVGSAVARHYDPATRFARQCDVANEHLKRTLPTPEAQATAGVGRCCEGRHDCNLAAALDQVLITVGHSGPLKAGPLAFDDLWEELPGLLCARIEHGERGHFVAIAGASMHGREKQVLVADPAVDGAFWCPYGVFRDSYLGDGAWTTTYWTE
jgi:hypothetical protein